MNASEEHPRSSTQTIVAIVLVTLCGFGLAVLAFRETLLYLQAHHAGFAAQMAAAFVYGAAILILAYLFARACQRVLKRTHSAASKRYTRRFMTAMSTYVVVLLGVAGAYRALHPVGALAYALAIAPSLPLIAAIVAMGLYLREETDEFERAMQAEAALWAMGGLLSIATVWGFLEMFLLVPHVESWAAFPIWAALLGPSQIIARRRYR